MLVAHTADLPPVDLDLALTFGAKGGSHDLPNGACLVFGVIGATVQANLQPVVGSLVLADEFVGIGFSILGMVGSGGGGHGNCRDVLTLSKTFSFYIFLIFFPTSFQKGHDVTTSRQVKGHLHTGPDILSQQQHRQ